MGRRAVAPAARSTPGRTVRALVLLATLVLGVLWVGVDHPFEGPILYYWVENHGIHWSDPLALLPPVAAAIWWHRGR